MALGTLGAGQSGPSLARLANGQTVAAWPTSDAGTKQIKVQRYDDRGAAVGAAVLIDAPSEPIDVFPNGDTQTASVAATSAGYVVSWCAYKDRLAGTAGRPLPGWDVFMRRFDVSGTPLGSVVQVNTEPANNCPSLSVVPLTGDRLAVAYRFYVYPFSPGPTPGVCRVRTFDAAGNGSAAVAFGNAETCSAAPLPDSGFAVVYEIFSYGPTHVYLRRFDANGSPVADEVSIDGGGSPYPGGSPLVNALHPDVATLPDGNLAIAWVRNGAVVAQEFASSGVPVGPRFQVAASAGSPKVTGLSDGAFALTWSQFPADLHELWSQSFSATGATRDQAVRLASFSNAAVKPGSDIAASSNGRYITGWQEPASGGGFNAFISRR